MIHSQVQTERWVWAMSVHTLPVRVHSMQLVLEVSNSTHRVTANTTGWAHVSTTLAVTTHGLPEARQAPHAGSEVRCCGWTRTCYGWVGSSGGDEQEELGAVVVMTL